MALLMPLVRSASMAALTPMKTEVSSRNNAHRGGDGDEGRRFERLVRGEERRKPEAGQRRGRRVPHLRHRKWVWLGRLAFRRVPFILQVANGQVGDQIWLTMSAPRENRLRARRRSRQQNSTYRVIGICHDRAF